MSSPGVLPGTPQWPPPATQVASPAGSSSNEEPGVTVKSMRLKILYTFDDQNKTNCLARWPQVLQIRTVAMDETTSIGVIELKTCIQAIVQCSPELVAKLGQDYTIYAYDYSEYDTPLVGQGMLSWALTASSPTPETPAQQSRQLITGRVCKNIQGLFSNGVAETLEVKLRLVPVPTLLQSEYLSTMEKYRELSKIMPLGFDHKEWFSFLQSNPNIAQLANKSTAPASNNLVQREGISMEVVNQLLSPSLTQNSADPFSNNVDFSGGEGQEIIGRRPAQKTSRPSSRNSVKRPYKRRAKPVTGGNTSGYEEGTDGDDGPTGKKRAKITQTDWNSKSSFGSVSDSLRVTASTAGSLRLFRPIALAPAPSSNATNHLQEVPRAPTPVPDIPSLPPMRDRALSQSGLRRDSVTSQIMGSQQQRRYQSPYQPPDIALDPQEQIRMSIESAMTSPEKNDSSAETPPEFGSSPPVRRTATPLQFSPPPSSPILPPMPRTDSGFMSGDISDLFEDEDEMRPAEEQVAVATKLRFSRKNCRPASPKPEIHHGFAIEEVTPGPPELLPTKMLPRAPPRTKAEPKAKAPRPRASLRCADSTISEDDINTQPTQSKDVTDTQRSAASHVVPLAMSFNSSFENDQVSTEVHPSIVSELPPSPGLPLDAVASAASVPVPASRRMSRTASAGSLTLPTISASDPVFPPSNLQRYEGMPGAPQPVVDLAAFSDRPGTANTISAGTMAKKNSIRQRLETAIAKGEMPPFCSNCGAIETPAWRRAWAQNLTGDPGYHEYSDEPGRVTAIDILERDAVGRPVTYRIYKKSLAEGEAKSSFSEVLLCNPCGIWMSKYKTQRPEHKWARDQERTQDRSNQATEKQPTERKRRDRSSKAKKGQAGYPIDGTSEAYLPSDVFGPSDNVAPSEIYHEPQHSIVAPVMMHHQEDPPERQRASSVAPARRIASGMTSNHASSALRRAIQSSPARWLGTRHSPIELEEDLGTTRRILFPSPRKDEPSTVLGEVVTNTVQHPVNFNSPYNRSKEVAAETSDKENCPPTPLFDDGDDEIRKLFEEELARPSRPTTPVQKRSNANLFKTPPRRTPSHRPITRSISKSARSSERREMLPQRTPSKTPSTAALRRSPRHNRNAVESPFTATLNKLLSEANGQHDTANESPSRHLDLGLDFSGLPDLGNSGSDGLNSDALTFHLPGFDPNTDFFSTDIPMPSSPPRFDLYEDPMTMQGLNNIDHSTWSDFPLDDSILQIGQGLVIDENGHATFEASKACRQETDKVIKVEPIDSPSRGEERETRLENEARDT